MEFFIFLIALLLVLIVFQNNETKVATIIVVSLVLLFLYAIRNEEVGNIDIPRYIDHFDNITRMGLKDMLARYVKDSLFYIGCWTVSRISSSYSIMFLAIGIIFINSVARLIYKYSNNYAFSFLVFVTFFYALNFSLLRHCVAFSMLILAYYFLKKDDIKAYFVLLLLGVLCQGTSLLGILFLPLSKVRFRWWFLGLIPICLVLSSTEALNLIISYLDQDRFMHYMDYDFKLNYTSIMIYAVLFAYVLFLMRNNFKENVIKYNLEINMMVVGLSLISMSVMIAEAIRLAMFFYFVIIILIPNLIKEDRTPLGRFVSAVFCVFIAFIFLFVSVTGAELIPFKTII